MALIVEAGSGNPSAESYISVADADVYHAGVGNSAWALLTLTAKENALRAATQYMGQAYRSKWLSVRATPTQALDWPRYGFEIDHGATYVQPLSVPSEVRIACAKLALTASASNLNPDVGRQTIKETVGPISVEYAPSAPVSIIYRDVEMMLSPYLSRMESNVRLVRT